MLSNINFWAKCLLMISMSVILITCDRHTALEWMNLGYFGLVAEILLIQNFSNLYNLCGRKDSGLEGINAWHVLTKFHWSFHFSSQHGFDQGTLSFCCVGIFKNDSPVIATQRTFWQMFYITCRNTNPNAITIWSFKQLEETDTSFKISTQYQRKPGDVQLCSNACCCLRLGLRCLPYKLMLSLNWL